MIKKFLSLAYLLLAVTFASKSQTVQDIFGNAHYTITWYGIDYSHSKIVGSLGLFGGRTPVSATDLRDRYYTSWNYLILDEPEKYNIAKIIRRKTIEKDLSMVKQLNAGAAMDSIEVPITPYYTSKEIQNYVSAYPISNKTGIGLIFIAESMNKSNANAFYHVVFFNIETKEVLLQERIRGSASGFGIRNYWASSYFTIINYIQEEGYAKWKKAYAPKAPDKSMPTW